MALDVKAGSQSWLTTDAVGTQWSQSCGFDPVIVFFMLGRESSTDGRTDEHYYLSFGAAISTTSRRTAGVVSRDARATGSTGGSWRDDSVIMAAINGGTPDGRLDVDQFAGGTNGFRLIVDDATANHNHRVAWLALGGTDVTNVAVGNFQEPGATGTQDITGLGFNPADGDLLVIWCANGVSVNTGASDLKWCLGACTSNADEHVAAVGSEEAAADMDTYNYGKSGSVIVILDDTGAVVAEAEFSAWITDGFRLNWIAAPSSTRDYCYAVVKGPKFKVGESAVRTTTGTHSVSSFGHTPEAAMVFSVGEVEEADSTGAAHNRFSYGMAESSTPAQRAFGTLDEDGLATSDCDRGSQADAVLHKFSNAADLQIMSLSSWDSDGLTFSTDTADGVASWFFYISAGLTAVAGGAFGRMVGGTGAPMGLAGSGGLAG